MKPNKPIQLSILIPTLNEAALIGELVANLKRNSSAKNIAEILVIDGGSKDGTVAIAKKNGAKVLPSKRGRATQMNFGAQHAKGEILYFLHADTTPPMNFDQDVLEAYREGFEVGCFRMKFDTNNLFLRFFGWLTRINHTLCRGGDQSLFIDQNTFKSSGGYNEEYIIYEDSELIGRLYRNHRFKIIPKNVITSARKYREKGLFKVQYHFAMIHFKNYMGAGPKELYEYYQKKILA